MNRLLPLVRGRSSSVLKTSSILCRQPLSPPRRMGMGLGLGMGMGMGMFIPSLRFVRSMSLFSSSPSFPTSLSVLLGRLDHGLSSIRAANEGVDSAVTYADNEALPHLRHVTQYELMLGPYGSYVLQPDYSSCVVRLFSPISGQQYSYSCSPDGQWRSTKDGHELIELLARELVEAKHIKGVPLF